ncbi:iron chelate uptake ABC transporter family permease subunit [Candidatus Peregrinibacteria bacterium]|nr:iron chelate uptake ABC transporter family permease subunit [Candidatus Peregrinibacteria bacterium]
MFDIFFLPFMQRALIAGLMVAILLGSLGVFVNIRNLSFLGDGIAHASLAGIALALLVGWMPTPTALILALFLAVAIFALERYSRISGDTAIGILFTTGMAIGIILLHYTPGFQPELISFLFGNILAIQSQDLWLTLFVGTIILVVAMVISKKLAFISLDEEGAYLSGLNPKRYILILYILTSLAIVLSIKLVGIVLVSALLITPSAISRILAKSFSSFQVQSVVWACLIVVLGLFGSVLFDLPSGATIIIVGTTLFLLSLLGQKVRSGVD